MVTPILFDLDEVENQVFKTSSISNACFLKG